MPTRTPTAVRQAIETELVSVLGALSPAWALSRLAEPAFPGADPQMVEALAYAVGLRGTVSGDRQRRSNPIVSSTEIVVRYTSQLQADDHVTTYDLAITRGQTLRDALRGLAAFPLRIDDEQRSLAADNTLFIGVITATVMHAY